MAHFTFILLFISISYTSLSQDFSPQHPIVPKFGGIYAIPEVEKGPDTTLTYRVVIDVTQGAEKSDELNPALNNIARMLNLHGLGGVPKGQMEVVAVIHSLATPTVLTDEAYQEKFGCDNPNGELIEALTDAGVQLFVCGQSLLARDFYPQPLHPDIMVSISALTILTEYQQNGFALLKF
ncbi:DsrE family protein [Tunicatimonas pelagia]|uniref:DsrE family protein n=1 Tax=Tunicatimonas pelagia TaxID=931531 RepID=UPI0026670BB1|nr:DsrE family protein [Tunicatimonas pelagia]WKN41356.1 DsrE family protein [Tunicatimonas pelagia]